MNDWIYLKDEHYWAWIREQIALEKSTGRHLRIGRLVDKAIEELGIRRTASDDDDPNDFIEDVLAANPLAIKDYRAGKNKALNVLVGKVLAAMKNKADPVVVFDMLKAKLLSLP